MKTLKEVLLVKNEFAEVYNNEVELKNGEIGTHFIVKTPNGVSVLPITKQGKIILVSNFKYANNEYVLEIPKGGLNADENYAEAAKRELLEESKYAASTLTSMGCAPFTNGILASSCEHFIAWDCVLSESTGDGDIYEDIEEVLLLDACKVYEMVMTGDIQDDKTIAVLMKFFATFAPLQPKDLTEKTSSYIMGMFCAAKGYSREYNPFRNMLDKTNECNEWGEGWRYYTFKSVSKK